MMAYFDRPVLPRRSWAPLEDFPVEDLVGNYPTSFVEADLDLVSYPSSYHPDTLQPRWRSGEPEHDNEPFQLPMFMTPREVFQTWEPLYGDRKHVDMDGNLMFDDGWGETDLDEYDVESDEQFWDRKVRETQTDTYEDDNETWARESYYGDHDSLYDDLVVNGVQSPVWLQYPDEVLEPEWSGDDHEYTGPSVLGGHHRLAVAMHSAPDDLVPVLFAHDTYDSRESDGYEYT